MANGSLEKETFVLYPSLLLEPRDGSPLVLEFSEGDTWKGGQLVNRWESGTNPVGVIPGTFSLLQLHHGANRFKVSVLDLISKQVTVLGEIPNTPYNHLLPGIPGILHLVLIGEVATLYEVTKTDLTVLQIINAEWAYVVSSSLLTGVRFDKKSKRTVCTKWDYEGKEGKYLPSQFKFPEKVRGVRYVRGVEGGMVLVCDGDDYCFDLKTLECFPVSNQRNVISTTCMLQEAASGYHLTYRRKGDWNRTCRIEKNSLVCNPFNLKTSCLLTRTQGSLGPAALEPQKQGALHLWFRTEGVHLPLFFVPNFGRNLRKYLLLPPSAYQKRIRLNNLLNVLTLPKALLEEVLPFCEA